MPSHGRQRRQTKLIRKSSLRVSPCRQSIANSRKPTIETSPPGKTIMSLPSIDTPSTCQSSDTAETSHHPASLLHSSSASDRIVTPTTSPSKQYRVLFADDHTHTHPIVSPIHSRVKSKQSSHSSPIGGSSNDDWREGISKIDHELLQEHLSMDSSLSSSSSLYEDQDGSAGTLGSLHTTKRRRKGGLWRCSRPRVMFLVLTTLGVAFSSLTFLLSSLVRHPVAYSDSDFELRSKFFPNRVRQSTVSAISLTALAQGQPVQKGKKRSLGDDTRVRKNIGRKRFVRKRSVSRTTAMMELPAVRLPTDWQQTVRERRPAELSFFHSKEDGVAEKPRVVFLNDPQLLSHRHIVRHIDIYPADFTDQTQLYPVLDSNDERIKGMEIRKPYTQGDCVPMADWQTTFHPSCNSVHELGLGEIGFTRETSFDLFGKKGFWRNAWRVETNQGRDVFVLKTLKVKHNFEEAHFEHDRIDAVAMERLTGSPHVIDIFGFCGHSVMTEYADGKRLGAVSDKASNVPLARLKMALDIAEGLADVHGIDGDDKVSFVHLDINPANVVIVDGKLKLNDFNIGIIRRWNTTSEKPCGFPAQFPNPQWRSPEEARREQNLTEKVDVFSMGHIFYRLIARAEPWNRLEPGGKPSKAQVNDKVQQGVLPTIPDFVANSQDPEIVAIRDAMLRCYQKEPQDRPSAREIARDLEMELFRLQRSTETF